MRPERTSALSLHMLNCWAMCAALWWRRAYKLDPGSRRHVDPHLQINHIHKTFGLTNEGLLLPHHWIAGYNSFVPLSIKADVSTLNSAALFEARMHHLLLTCNKRMQNGSIAGHAAEEWSRKGASSRRSQVNYCPDRDPPPCYPTYVVDVLYALATIHGLLLVCFLLPFSSLIRLQD